MEPVIQKERIWEIDFLRGLLIPGMILIHIVYDAVYLYGFAQWQYPAWYMLLQYNYGGLFVLVSGISVTLGSHCVARGLRVFAAGMLCTAVTAAMYGLGLADRGVIIYFGVLHCIGVCMLLWQPLQRLRVWVLVVLGVGLATAGQILRYQVFDFPWLVILGFVFPGFSSSDYFPLMPNLGYFLLGAALGRTLYRKKRSLLPHAPVNSLPIRFFTFCGRHSLLIYLLHQPVLSGIFEGIVLLRKL